MNPLYEISKVTDNLYLSGVFPLETDDIIKYNINYVVCCVDPSNVSAEHVNILQLVPNICILYLPYNDIVTENLWKINNGEISILVPDAASDQRDKFRDALNLYKGKTYIEIGYHFINSALKSNSNVLIHCMAGVSRSVSVLCYYLMKKINLNYPESISYIKKYRPIASPNRSFVKQLIVYSKLRDKYRSGDSDLICASFYQSI
jgi:predicted protein tyrosine phosphatase